MWIVQIIFCSRKRVIEAAIVHNWALQMLQTILWDAKSARESIPQTHRGGCSPGYLRREVAVTRSKLAETEFWISFTIIWCMPTPFPPYKMFPFIKLSFHYHFSANQKTCCSWMESSHICTMCLISLTSVKLNLLHCTTAMIPKLK